MKRIIISSAIAMSAAAAHAESITVMTPKAGASSEEVATYIAQLDRAVVKVCRAEYSPVYGVAFQTYLACLKKTRVEVGKRDPTGFYAAKESKGDLVIASK